MVCRQLRRDWIRFANQCRATRLVNEKRYQALARRSGFGCRSGRRCRYLHEEERTNGQTNRRATDKPENVWARPGMTVTFRAELMPGRDREARTARVKELLPSGRVLLHEIAGEHGQSEFDPILRSKKGRVLISQFSFFIFHSL